MFNELTMEEMQELNGGGPVALFVSCLAIAFSPAVACYNPGLGAELFLAGLGGFFENLPK